jgi:hypothetical protein
VKFFAIARVTTFFLRTVAIAAGTVRQYSAWIAATCNSW